MKYIMAVLLMSSISLSGQSAQSAQTDPSTAEAAKLRSLIEADWEWRIDQSPEFATWLGDQRSADRWSDLSAAARAKRKQHAPAMLPRLKSIDRAKLSDAEKLNLDLFELDLEERVEAAKYPADLIAITQMGGVHQDIGDMLLLMPRRTPKDFANIAARIRAGGTLVDQEIANLREGLAKGITPPRIAIREVPKQLETHLVEKATESPIYELVAKDLPTSLTAGQQQTVRSDVSRALAESLIPAYRRLHTFLVNEYLPKSRESIALTALPNGADWYRMNVRRMTTTDLSPDQIHEIGQSEVKRIRGEMERVKTEAGFDGSLTDFFTFLRSDPRFFYKTREELLVGYRDIAKRIDPELPRLFGKLPRLPYGVAQVPEYSERTQTTAYYNPGSPKSGRAGLFYANTYDLSSRPKWEMEALTVHEAVPGHHLQIALAQELDDIPDFRRNGRYTAFVEGWGLYSESLGPELGLYRDPYSRFGQLTYEMWRAIRLVVDTGMHAKGWTRQQAIDFFKANSSKPEHDITVEIDRYIVWPGQALAYKLGELKIRELRKRAETKLGERFDIRAFHDTVLGAGPLPLSVLEKRIDDWIAR